MYRSPSGGKEKFIVYFDKVMEELVDVSLRECIIFGDFNIDWLTKGNYYTRNLQASIKAIGMKQMVEEGTRVTKDRLSNLLKTRI